MSIPSVSDAPFSVQQALRNIDERLSRLEKNSDSLSRDELNAAIKSVRTEIRGVAGQPTFRSWFEVFKSTEAVGDRIVLRPSAGGHAFVIPDGNSLDPGVLRGAIVEATDWAKPDPIRKFNLMGSLSVQGSLLASKITTGNLVVAGLINSKMPGGGLRRDANWSRTASGAWTKISSFNTAIEDNDGIADTTNSRLVCRTPGVYRVSGFMYASRATSGNATGWWLYKNGSALESPGCYNTIYGVPAAAVSVMVFVEPLRLNVGDYLEVTDYTDIDMTYQYKNTFFSMQWIRP